MKPSEILDNLYFDNDADISIIQSKEVAVIGYGNQGRAQALNLADSQVNVKIGLRSTSKSIKTAQKDGFNVVSIEDAVKTSDVIVLLVPDQVMAKVYRESCDDEPDLLELGLFGVCSVLFSGII